MRLAALAIVALLPASLRAQPERHVVIVDIDGVRRDLLETAYLSGRTPQLERLVGSAATGRGFEDALYFEHATSVAPTVTMAGQASLFTGVYPAVHGIPGNQWFDRFGGGLTDYMSYAGAACVYGISLSGGSGCQGGRGNRDLVAPTLYDWATAAGQTSVVVHSQYWAGATRVITPSLLDGFVAIREGELNLDQFDHSMAVNAIDEIRQHGRPAILTLYFAGADASGHARGNAALMDYLSQTVDPLLGAFFDALDQIDPRWRANTMFVISCDHGRTETSGTPADQLALTQAKDVLLRAGFDPDSIEFANDIGLAHVYLRPAGADWSESPDASALRAAAEALAADPALAGEVEFVCYRNGNYSCVPLLDQDRLRLLERLNSGRTGDVLLLARPARYFGNGQAIGSHHGALDDTDLAVPLILAAGGIRPGRVTEPVGTVQIVASIASYLGIPVENTEPVLPGLNFGRAKAQTLVTGHTKVPE